MQAPTPQKRHAGPVGRRLHRGFNLVELMVVVAILAVVMAAGVPSFQFIINSSRVSSPANEMLATLQLARMEAIRSNARTVVCQTANPLDPSPTCTTVGGNWTGWLAFVDDNANGAFDGADVRLRVHNVEAPAVLSASAAISGAQSRIIFRPDGLARTGAGALLAARLRICMATTTPQENARDIAITAGSRFSVLRVDAAGACAAPANT